jgi:hypothetical protein
MHIVHFQPSVLLGSHQSFNHIVVVSQVPSCNPFYALLVLVYCRSQMSTMHGVGPPLSHVVLISHVTSRTILSESSKWTSVLIAINVSSQVSSRILPGALMALVSHQGQSNTQGSVVPFCAVLVRSHHDFVYLHYSIIQENIISNRVNDRFTLEVLSPIGDVVLDIGF